MQELLILGLIPGTNIQITFVIWLAFVASCFIAIFASLMKRRHAIRNAIIAFVIARQTRRIQA